MANKALPLLLLGGVALFALGGKKKGGSAAEAESMDFLEEVPDNWGGDVDADNSQKAAALKSLGYPAAQANLKQQTKIFQNHWNIVAGYLEDKASAHGVPISIPKLSVDGVPGKNTTEAMLRATMIASAENKPWGGLVGAAQAGYTKKSEKKSKNKSEQKSGKKSKISIPNNWIKYYVNRMYGETQSGGSIPWNDHVFQIYLSWNTWDAVDGASALTLNDIEKVKSITKAFPNGNFSVIIDEERNPKARGGPYISIKYKPKFQKEFNFLPGYKKDSGYLWPVGPKLNDVSVQEAVADIYKALTGDKSWFEKYYG